MAYVIIKSLRVSWQLIFKDGVLFVCFFCPVWSVSRSIIVVPECLPAFVRILSMVQLHNFNELFILRFIPMNRLFSVQLLKIHVIFGRKTALRKIWKTAVKPDCTDWADLCNVFGSSVLYDSNFQSRYDKKLRTRWVITKTNQRAVWSIWYLHVFRVKRRHGQFARRTPQNDASEVVVT